MAYLIDSNIAIYWRDGEPHTLARLATLEAVPAISVLTRVELEGGMHARPVGLRARQSRWAQLKASLTVHLVDEPVATAYARIVAARGFSRPKIIDRLIAATAIVHGLTLITINGDDFRDIPGLSLEIWPVPAQ